MEYEKDLKIALFHLNIHNFLIFDVTTSVAGLLCEKCPQKVLEPF